jgi:hypothetical protein
MRVVAIGSDHAGVSLKQEIERYPTMNVPAKITICLTREELSVAVASHVMRVAAHATERRRLHYCAFGRIVDGNLGSTTDEELLACESGLVCLAYFLG